MIPEEVLLNVNSPNLPLGRIAGVEVTRLSKQSYCDMVEKDENCDGCYRIRRGDENSHHINRGSDIWALRDNRISITALFDGSAGNSSDVNLHDLASVIRGELGMLSLK